METLPARTSSLSRRKKTVWRIVLRYVVSLKHRSLENKRVPGIMQSAQPYNRHKHLSWNSEEREVDRNLLASGNQGNSQTQVELGLASQPK